MCVHSESSRDSFLVYLTLDQLAAPVSCVCVPALVKVAPGGSVSANTTLLGS